MVSHDESLRCDTDRMDALASTLNLTGDRARALAGRITEAQLLAALPGAGVARLHTVAETAAQSASVVTARARLAAGFTIEPRAAIRLDDRLAAGEVDAELAVPLDARARQHVADAQARLRAAGGKGKGRPTGADVRSTLGALTPTELEATIGGLADAEIEALFRRLKAGPDHGGLSRADRLDLYADIGERVSRALWQRLGSLSAEIEPRVASVVGRLPKVALGGRRTRWEVDDLQGPLAVTGPGDAQPFDDDDVQQGYLGDCYLMAVVQSLAAQHPELLASLFHRNPNGTVTVRIASGARAVVDPTFVTEVKRPDAPVFVHRPWEHDAGATVGEIWGPVLEKAWAILRGGYGKTWSGKPGRTLAALVGGTVTSRDPDDFGAHDLARRLAAGEILTVRTEPDADDPRIEPHHAYRLVAVDPEHHLATLENPWDAGGTRLLSIPLADLVRVATSIDANRLPTGGDGGDRR